MQRFKNILLVLDGADLTGSATTRAIQLAKKNQARLNIVDVLPQTRITRSLQSFSEKIERLQLDVEEQRRKELERLAQTCGPEVTIRVDVLSGKPFVEIIRYVLRHNCDLVIKAVSQDKYLASMLFGSIDFRLLRKCPCPLWLVKADDVAGSKRILAAVELESFDDEKDLENLNSQIVEIASSLAFRQSAELHLVNAWVVFDGEELAKRLSKNYQNNASAWVVEQSKSIEAAQEKFVEGFKKHVRENGMESLHYSFHFLEGEADQVIVDFADKKNIDLVVMGTIARTDLAGFLFGNTSEAVLSQINSSVLAVKPSGFISPISLQDN